MATTRKTRRTHATQPDVVQHPNGAQEVTFQVMVAPDESRPDRRCRGKPRTQQPPEPVAEEESGDSNNNSNTMLGADNHEARNPTSRDNVPPPLPSSPNNPFSPDTQLPSSPSRPALHTANSESIHSTTSSSNDSRSITPIRIEMSPGRPRSWGQPRSGPHSNNSPKPRRKQKNLTKAKDVWGFYEPYYDDAEGEDRRRCLFCKHHSVGNPRYKIATFADTTGTSTLRKHLIDLHPEPWVEGCEQMGIPITAKAAQASGGSKAPRKAAPVRQSYSREVFVDALVEFIVANDQSLNVIESPELRAIFLMLREDLNDSDIPHRTKLRERIIELWEEHIKKLKSELATAMGKVSFTTDMWSDTNLSPFMAVTAHWIEGIETRTESGETRYRLQLRSALVGFHRVPGRHSGEHLAQAFLYVLDRIGITDRIGWITLDNAGNNNTLVTYLEHELRRRRIKFDAVRNRIRCFPHVVNLACKAVIEAVPSHVHGQSAFKDVTTDPIASVRALVRVIRSSSIRRQYFSAIVKTLDLEDLQLLRDVETRWSSTLLMIERVLDLQPAVDKFLQNDDFDDIRKHKLSEEEWKALDLCKDILRVPHVFQQRLSAEKTPTLSRAIPGYAAMAKLWENLQATHPDAHALIQAGLDKLQSYSELTDLTPAYTFAMFVNPRSKLRWFSNNQAHRLSQVKEMIIRELRTYRIESTIKTPARPQVQRKKRYDPAWEEMMHEFDNASGHSAPAPTGPSSLETEVEAYLLDARTGTTIISYWEDNQRDYPTIFRMAMDILPIQGSAVPCERVFSSAKETMTARRNRIRSDLMEALQMLKFSYKAENPLNFTIGTSREEELEELEDETSYDAQVPEDVMEFIQTLIPLKKQSSMGP